MTFNVDAAAALSYIVPGVLALNVQKFLTGGELGPIHVDILNSLLYSFLSLQIARLMLPLAKSDQTSFMLLLFAIAAVLGGAVGKFSGSGLARALLLKVEASPDENAWQYTIETSRPCWIRIFLDDKGVIYDGKLLAWSKRPHATKELVLTSFKRYDTNGVLLEEGEKVYLCLAEPVRMHLIK